MSETTMQTPECARCGGPSDAGMFWCRSCREAAHNNAAWRERFREAMAEGRAGYDPGQDAGDAMAYSLMQVRNGKLEPPAAYEKLRDEFERLRSQADATRDVVLSLRVRVNDLENRWGMAGFVLFVVCLGICAWVWLG